MKTLRKVLGITGITALSFLPLKNYGQNLVMDEDGEIFLESGFGVDTRTLNKILQSFTNVNLSLYNAGFHASYGKYYCNSFKSSEDSSSNFKYLKKEMDLCSKYLDTSLSSLEYFAEHSNNTGIYQSATKLYSASGENVYSSVGKTTIPLTSDKAKEFLPKFRKLKNIKDNLIDDLKEINLNNINEYNKFSSEMNVFLEYESKIYDEIASIYYTHITN